MSSVFLWLAALFCFKSNGNKSRAELQGVVCIRE
uniref:Uncharacterized protein n=1 Tax=Anguilla anguilla TaxID=7936 RepID=A0A0E9TD10_ANGAN